MRLAKEPVCVKAGCNNNKMIIGRTVNSSRPLEGFVVTGTRPIQRFNWRHRFIDRRCVFQTGNKRQLTVRAAENLILNPQRYAKHPGWALLCYPVESG